MLIKLRHKITRQEVFITTSGDDANEPITWELSEEHREQLIYEFCNSHGFYGHLITLDTITNLDLSYAARSLPSFDLISISPKMEPKALPEGAKS